MASGILEQASSDDEPMFLADFDSCDCAPMPAARPAEPRMEKSILPHAPKARPGRIASMFRLNRAKYDEMKEDGGKTEF